MRIREVYVLNDTKVVQRIIHGDLGKIQTLPAAPGGFIHVENQSAAVQPGQAVIIPMVIWNTGRGIWKAPWTKEITKAEFTAMQELAAPPVADDRPWYTFDERKVRVDKTTKTRVTFTDDEGTVSFTTAERWDRESEVWVETDAPKLILDIEAVAAAAHEANRLYCNSIGDNSQVAWDQAADWQRGSAIAGVLAVQENPEITPEALHENWMRDKAADGWKYGPEKDAERKLHPCMIPYDLLPTEQKAKDAIFYAVVTALLPFVPVADE